MLFRSEAFDHWLTGALARDGLDRFILGTGRGLVEAVGTAWGCGGLTVWHEHYFTEKFSGAIRAVLAGIPSAEARPRIMLATPAGERHGLGLLMVQALFAAHGAACMSLGTDVPVDELLAAAAACGADVVVLSISPGFWPSRATEVLRQIRPRLPERTALWVGG